MYSTPSNSDDGNGVPRLSRPDVTCGPIVRGGKWGFERPINDVLGFSPLVPLRSANRLLCFYARSMHLGFVTPPTGLPAGNIFGRAKKSGL